MQCDRRTFLKSIGIGVASLALPQTARPENRKTTGRPNVVLVMTDDQGYGDMGCTGNPVIQTPHLDRLHAESVRLTDFHVAPTCAPTRAGLMTGRWCNRTGVWHTIMGRSMLRRDEHTMANAFADAGYRTGIFGKWHLGDNYPFRPQDRGFQEVWINGGGGVGQTPDYWGNNYFDDTYFHNGKPVACKGYCTDVWFDKALGFIQANKDKPFFCYVPTNAPHGPYLVAEKYSKRYRDKGVKGSQAAFYGMITNIDENMGRLTAKLQALGLAENTLLVFMTDNGTSAGWAAGMRGRKGSEYEGGHRVPCFLRWPGGGLGGGRDVTRLTAHTDLLPTLAELCGLKLPKVKLDGRSIVPLLQSKGDWPDRTLVVDSQRIENPEKWRKSAVMTDRWRLVNGKELYDIQADPGQKKNVAADHPNVLAKLRTAYEAWWKSSSTRFGEYCHTILGSDSQNPVTITCHDWHGRSVPWNQRAIRAGAKANGFWAVEIEKAGRYEISLRRWPEELDEPITATGPGKAISATKARLKIGGVDETKPITPLAKAVTFTVTLPPGKTRLETWFADEKADSRGAYYVYVKRLT